MVSLLGANKPNVNGMNYGLKDRQNNMYRRFCVCCSLINQNGTIQCMSLVSHSLTEILNEIGTELTNQISLANNADKKIDSRKLAQQSDTLNDAIAASELSDEDKSMLQKFSLTLVQDSSTVKSLRYERQDLERVLSNIANI
jgi:hypothetical protein